MNDHKQVALPWCSEWFPASVAPAAAKSLAALLDETEERGGNEAVAEFNAGYKCAERGGAPSDEPNEIEHDEWLIGFAWFHWTKGDGKYTGRNNWPPIFAERDALRAQVAELERLLEMTERDNDHFDDWVERAKKAESDLAASRIEAARLAERINEAMLVSIFGTEDQDEQVAEADKAPDLRCAWSWGFAAGARSVSKVLAATSESAAAWLAEVQRKALERARARILEVGDAVLPRVRESMGDHPMFSDAGFKTWMAEFVRTMAAVFADAARDPDLSVDANLDRSLIPEPKALERGKE